MQNPHEIFFDVVLRCPVPCITDDLQLVICNPLIDLSALNQMLDERRINAAFFFQVGEQIPEIAGAFRQDKFLFFFRRRELHILDRSGRSWEVDGSGQNADCLFVAFSLIYLNKIQGVGRMAVRAGGGRGT